MLDVESINSASLTSASCCDIPVPINAALRDIMNIERKKNFTENVDELCLRHLDFILVLLMYSEPFVP